jgi:hypothetical protein
VKVETKKYPDNPKTEKRGTIPMCGHLSGNDTRIKNGQNVLAAFKTIAALQPE